jgi:predicted DNA binding CopG/RHH family protein
MAARNKTPTRKASGANIEEWQRHTTRLMLRVGPSIVDRAKERALALGLNLSEYISQLVATDHRAALHRGTSAK